MVERKKLSVVVSVYNEEEALGAFYNTTVPILADCGWNYELIFVNDGSKDKSQQLLEEFAKENGAVYLDLDREEYRSQLGLDPAVDYYDQGHMNLTGVMKVSDWLGDWLDTNYDLPDHRNDPAISESWNADLAQYKEKTGLQ